MRRKVAFVCASEMTIRAFLIEHIRTLSLHYDVSVIADSNDPELLIRLGIDVRLMHAPIARNIAPLRDLRALLILYCLFRKHGFDLVHSVTPKAGLLSALAAYAARVPLRMHTFTGQVWATRSGPMRALLKTADRLIAALSTHVLADSRTQRDFIVREGVVTAPKVEVLAQGSVAGVDIARFRPDREARARVRRLLTIPDSALVFLYLGRLNRDKGVPELCQAFAMLAERHPGIHLILTGPDEAGIRAELEQTCKGVAARLHVRGYTDEPQAYFAAADVFCLASHREGFGTAVIEAAACGLPGAGSRIYGVIDAIVERETGLLFEVKNAAALAVAMESFVLNPDSITAMGEHARTRATRDFAAPVLTAALLDCYRRQFAR